MSMYIWEVTLETEWKYVVKAGTKVVRSYKYTNSSEEFNVAAPSGIQAIEKAKKLAVDGKERGYVDDWSDENEVVTATPHRVLDIVGLELKDTLDG